VDLRADPAPAVDRAVETERLDGLDAPVKRDPRHHLRIGEMMASAPHLPDAFIGGAPHGFEMREERALKLPRRREVLETADPRMMSRIHHLAEDIELELAGGGIADAHGF
jgi:hypothetical protein